MYMCIHICVYIYIYIYIYFIYIYICIHVCYIYIYIYTYATTDDDNTTNGIHDNISNTINTNNNNSRLPEEEARAAKVWIPERQGFSDDSDGEALNLKPIYFSVTSSSYYS